MAFSKRWSIKVKEDEGNNYAVVSILVKMLHMFLICERDYYKRLMNVAHIVGITYEEICVGKSYGSRPDFIYKSITTFLLW